MATEKTMRVRGSGGGVFDVIVTPRVLKKLKTGVLVRVEVTKPKRSSGDQKPKDPKTDGGTGDGKPAEGPKTDEKVTEPKSDKPDGGKASGDEKPVEADGKAA